MLWSQVATGWYRVAGGTPEQMAAELAARTEFAETEGYGSRFAVTERGADGRCPKPGERPAI